MRGNHAGVRLVKQDWRERGDPDGSARRQAAGVATLLDIAKLAEQGTVSRPGVREHPGSLGAPSRDEAAIPRAFAMPATPSAYAKPVPGWAAQATLVPARSSPADTAPVPSRRRRQVARHASRLPFRQRLAYRLLLVIGLLLAIRFAVFWFNPARLPRVFSGSLNAEDMVLFGGLTFVVWHRQAMDILGWLMCSRIEPHHEAPTPKAGLRVAFITTFVPSCESIGMLKTTLLSMLAADYPHDTWVLDEWNDPAVRNLCELIGVKHFSRHGVKEYHQARGAFLTKSKGGNHEDYLKVFSLIAAPV